MWWWSLVKQGGCSLVRRLNPYSFMALHQILWIALSPPPELQSGFRKSALDRNWNFCLCSLRLGCRSKYYFGLQDLLVCDVLLFGIKIWPSDLDKNWICWKLMCAICGLILNYCVKVMHTQDTLTVQVVNLNTLLVDGIGWTSLLILWMNPLCLFVC